MTAWRAYPATRACGEELLDDPACDPSLAVRSLRDVARANRFFGGADAVLAELRPLLPGVPRDGALTVVDIGAGLGDILSSARRLAAACGTRLETIGLELTHPLALAARSGSAEAVAATAMALPFADRSVDVVICSQVLHHFDDADGAALLREMARVARVRVIVADLRRSWVAAAGLWAASWLCGFHPVSRHDGVLSVLRGFRREELVTAVRRATGRDADVRDRRGFRVTASWSPA
jgi:SAM-dependent methyltransferase